MPITLQDALDRVEARLQAPFGTFWAEQEGRFALTEAVRVWQVLTGTLVADIDMPVTAGTVWAAVPRTLISIKHLALNGTPLKQYSTAELDAEFGDWEAATAATPLRWAPEGATLVALNPPPASDVVLTATGIRDVPLLADGDVLEISNEELTRVLGYAHSPYLTFKRMPPELETESLSRMAKSAGEANAALRKLDFYRRYAGRDRVFADGQDSKTEAGPESLGAR